MAKVKATRLGYYKHRRIKPGTVFEMKEVDDEFFYLDAEGRRKKFPKYDQKGNEKGSEERKCKWVAHPDSEAGKPLDPKEVAAVLSGKRPGISNPLDHDELM